jgi:hypothetical protein
MWNKNETEDWSAPFQSCCKTDVQVPYQIIQCGLSNVPNEESRSRAPYSVGPGFEYRLEAWLFPWHLFPISGRKSRNIFNNIIITAF